MPTPTTPVSNYPAAPTPEEPSSGLTGEVLGVLCLDETNETFIGASGARTRVVHGTFGAKAWLARITGVGGQWGLVREFVNKEKIRPTSEDTSEAVIWPGPLQEGVYEWRDLCVGETATTWRSSGFALINADTVVRITKAQATELVTAATSAHTPEPEYYEQEDTGSEDDWSGGSY
jgi:hypothetical protein